MPYLVRAVDTELDALLPQVAAIALEGPKAVGKTATAERRVARTIRLDDPAQRAIATADPALTLQTEPPLLLDEWQHVPPIWDAVRRAVDAGAPPGRYLLAGSAVPPGASIHSGAGRIISLRMRPLALSERGVVPPTVSLQALLRGDRGPVAGATDFTLRDYVGEIVASGFPGIRALPERARRAQLDGYLERIVHKDFEEQGHKVRRPDTLRRWMAAYAAATSTIASQVKIRDAATGGDGQAPANTTTITYRDVLEQLYLLDPIPGWIPTRSFPRRLAVSPKHHLADPALAARLLGLDAHSLLRGEGPTGHHLRHGTFLGQLFESLVALSIRVHAQTVGSRVAHLRTDNGVREIDLLVEAPDQRILAIETKLGAVVSDDDVRHLRWLATELRDELLDAVVVTTGTQAYRRADGIAVIPAVLLGP